MVLMFERCRGIRILLLLALSRRSCLALSLSPPRTGFSSLQHVCSSQKRLYMKQQDVDRRDVLSWGIVSVFGTSFLSSPPCHAMGLVQFPCRQPLGNTYHFMRAGQNLMEADDIWSTNPLFLTNREAALSSQGQEQVEAACRILQEQDVNPSIVRYSLAASAMDTANTIGRELKVGRDRLVPEFNYIDPRAVGRYDMFPLSTTQAAVWAMDADEAGADGKGGRPPPNEDGTPHETLADQSIRLRQLLSVLETQYSGDTVVLVFPDGTGPALLSAMIAGIPLNRVHELEYEPGEIRLNVTMASTLAFLKENDREEYNKVIAAGRQELKRLRSLKPDEVISVKDRMLEKDRLETEAKARMQEQKRIEKEQADRAAREARDRQIREERQQARGENGAGSLGLSSTVLLDAAGISVTGATVALMAGNSDEEEEETIASLSNRTETESQDSTVDVASVNGLPEVRPTVVVSSIGSDGEREEIASSRVNGDRQATFPSPPKTRDPAKAAEVAMKEYMDSDDGGSAWLEVLSDIMMEDDEDVSKNE